MEFIQNPAVEGTRLARSGNDLVAVILPEPARKGQKINLRFVYGGDVLAEAGKGLLYVGERGTWYPNRGLAMADFDLTFHYPAGLDSGGDRQTSAASKRLRLNLRLHQPQPQNAATSKWRAGFRNGPSPWPGSISASMFEFAAQAGNVTGRNLRYGRSGTRFSPASAATNCNPIRRTYGRGQLSPPNVAPTPAHPVRLHGTRQRWPKSRLGRFVIMRIDSVHFPTANWL